MAKSSKPAVADRDMQVAEIENEVRDIINWVSVFEEEYELDKEVVDTLRKKLESVANKVGSL